MTTIANGEIAACCQDEANRDTVEVRQVEHGRCVVERCRECGRRHITLEADPIHLGAQGGSV